MLIFLPSRPSTEGCLIKHLQMRGGERWPGNDFALEMPARRPGGPSRSRPGPPAAGHRSRLAKAVDRQPYNPQGEAGCLKGYVHRGRCGADLQTPRAGRLGFGGLAAFYRTSASLDVARCRGPWVLRDFWRPARPRFFFEDGGLDYGVPGARRESGRRSVG